MSTVHLHPRPRRGTRYAVSALVTMLALLTACDSKSEGGSTGTTGDDTTTTGDEDESGDDAIIPDIFDEGDEGDGEGDNGGEFVSDDSLSGCEKIDFLFVVDNSASMEAEQRNLQNSVPGFIQAIDGVLELEDYHLGVISTDASETNVAGCQELGALVVRNGKEVDCGPYAEGHNYMTEQDDLSTSFPCAADLGIRGNDDERPMDALGATLSGSLSCNEGFIRDDALLVLTVLTDEEDDYEERTGGVVWGSSGDPEDWFQTVLAAKGGKRSNIAVLGLLGKPKPNNCIEGNKVNGAELSPRLLEFVDKFGNNARVGDVCSRDYEPFFASVLDLIEAACDDFIPPARQ